MCEESACLVPQSDTCQNGQTERQESVSVSSEAGGRATPNSGEALVGFHEDALSQAAMGKAQLLLSIVLGFGLAADCSEWAILGYILPAAELHFCIDEHKQGWLVSITLLAMAVGSVGWGILGDHLGRRRTLISALSVAALFSAVAAVMPTYGTFMTARFCSGLGVSGAFPLSFSYLTETCSRSSRSRYAGLLHSMWPLGALFISLISFVTMPSLGVDIVQDNREHWSSWHKFLILSILPSIACIIGLMWASESPRYLLEASREVEALAVYQRLHKLNSSRTQYGLTELELPGRNAYRDRPTSPSRNIFAQGLNTFQEAFQKISSPAHFQTTIVLGLLHFIIGFLFMGTSTFYLSIMKKYRNEEYLSARKYIDNTHYVNHFFNTTIDNVEYFNSEFKNSTFTHINLNHVVFLNCSVDSTEFLNVKLSVSEFENSIITNSKFIDTDMNDYHFTNCFMENNTFISLISDCFVDFDYNIFMDDQYNAIIGWSICAMPALIFTGLVLESTRRSRVILAFSILTACSSVMMFFLLKSPFATVVFIGMKLGLTCAILPATLSVVEAYPCHLRCTAHGFLRSLFHIGSICAISLYSPLIHQQLIIPGILTSVTSCFIALISHEIQDNSKVLL